MTPTTNASVWLARVAARYRDALILTIAAIGFLCQGLSAQTADSPSAPDQPKQWQSTTDVKSHDLLPERIPVRIIESHSQNGDHMLDRRSVEIRGTDGEFQAYQEIEKETQRLDGGTVRTTTRTYARDVNGARSLLQVTEEETRIFAGGDSTVLRTTLNPDLDGKLQPVQREIVETRTVGTDLREIDTTVMLPNINGGLAPAFKTQELQKRHADATTESQKTTLLADGTGKWELSETRRATASQDGSRRTVEERVSRRDAEGKMEEVSRMVTKESDSGFEEDNKTTETYSMDVPGTTRDKSLHLVERTTTARQTTATGERTSVQRVEQVNPGDPSAGLRVSILINDRMVPASDGEQSTVTIRARDSNGSFGIVAVDTTNSDRISTIQIQHTPSEQSK